MRRSTNPACGETMLIRISLPLILTAMLLLSFAPNATTVTAAHYDLLIRNGTIVDGSGAPRYRADVAIKGDRIVRIGKLRSEDATRVIDATGLVRSEEHTSELQSPYVIS